MLATGFLQAAPNLKVADFSHNHIGLVSSAQEKVIGYVVFPFFGVSLCLILLLPSAPPAPPPPTTSSSHSLGVWEDMPRLSTLAMDGNPANCYVSSPGTSKQIIETNGNSLAVVAEECSRFIVDLRPVLA